MRDRLWTLARSAKPAGTILPWWLMAIRAILFPLDFFYWRMSLTRGYQLRTDTWIIHGVKYADQVFCLFSDAEGETYRIWRTGDVITLERIEPCTPTPPQSAATSPA